jgi:23S rRNA pseudouridine1911/1915/1917 synthase
MDAYAARVFEPLTSRSQARKAIKGGRLTRNDQSVGTGHFVHPGDDLFLTISAAPQMPDLAMDLEVPYLDPHLAVVYKPAGIHVRGNRARTVHRALRYNIGVTDEPGALPDPDPVHRLDKRTQGLLVVARTAAARHKLGDAFKERRVQKRYRAIVIGRLEGAGEVSTPLDGREAYTAWQVVSHTRSLHTDWMTTVDLRPTTGRTHQLRRHMVELGHAILGDDLHTTGLVLRGSGLFLCAAEIRFDHPITGETVHVEAAEPRRFASTRAREARRWDRWNETEDR